MWHQLLENERSIVEPDSQRGSLLGPACDGFEITAMLRARGAVYRIIDDEYELCDKVAELIADGKVVGWVQGGMEFGPRALGNRSILGDARNPEMQRVMNVKIKFRESFRPFAPVVLSERASEFFELRPKDESPYMLLVAPLRPEKRVAVPAGGKPGLSRVAEVRSVVPAVTSRTTPNRKAVSLSVGARASQPVSSTALPPSADNLTRDTRSRLDDVGPHKSGASLSGSVRSMTARVSRSYR